MGHLLPNLLHFGENTYSMFFSIHWVPKISVGFNFGGWAPLKFFLTENCCHRFFLSVTIFFSHQIFWGTFILNFTFYFHLTFSFKAQWQAGKFSMLNYFRTLGHDKHAHFHRIKKIALPSPSVRDKVSLESIHQKSFDRTGTPFKLT